MLTKLAAEPGGGLVEPVHHGTNGGHRLQHGVAHGGPGLQVGLEVLHLVLSPGQ